MKRNITKSIMLIVITIIPISFVTNCRNIKTVYDFKVNETHQYRILLDYKKNAYGFSGDGLKRDLPSAESKLELVFSEKVTKIGPDNEYYLEHKIDDIKFSQSESSQLQTAQYFKKFIGNTYKCIFYPNGEIKFQDINKIDPGVAGEFGFKDLMCKNKLVFPQEIVSLGFEWTVEKKEPIDALYYGTHEMNGKATYRIGKTETINNIKSIRIDISQDLKTLKPKSHKMDPSPFTSTISGESHVTGTAYFSTTQRLPVLYKETSQSKISIEVLFEQAQDKAKSLTINEMVSNLTIELIK